MTEPTRFSLDELAARCDLPVRTIRYYIQRGLVDRPQGERRGSYYTATHLEQLLTVRKWAAAGVALERIAELQGGREPELPPPRRRPGEVSVWSHLYLAEGVELTIEPGLAGLSPEAVRELARGVAALYERIKDRERDDGIRRNR